MASVHYIYRPPRLNAKLFNRVRDDVATMLRALQQDYDLDIAGPNGKGDPISNSDVIAFNGVRRCPRAKVGTDLFGRIYPSNCAGEDFVFERDYTPWAGQQPTERPVTFDVPPRTPLSLFCSFCKTEEKPYEFLIACCGLILKEHFGKNVLVRTNGTDADFDYPRILVSSRLFPCE